MKGYGADDTIDDDSAEEKPKQLPRRPGWKIAGQKVDATTQPKGKKTRKEQMNLKPAKKPAVDKPKRNKYANLAPPADLAAQDEDAEMRHD
jgi:hypothetical protein